MHSKIELIELQFEERGKSTDYPETTSGVEKRTNNELNPHKTPVPGIEPGTHFVGGERFHYCAFPAPPTRGKNRPVKSLIILVLFLSTRFFSQLVRVSSTNYDFIAITITRHVAQVKH